MDWGCYDDSTGSAPHTGTTIVAVSFEGGVVVGADSRVSTGNYISNRASDKLTPLADNVWLMRSGSAADTQAVSDYGGYKNPALCYIITVAGGIWQVRDFRGSQLVAKFTS
jgi:hypothetical protein